MLPLLERHKTNISGKDMRAYIGGFNPTIFHTKWVCFTPFLGRDHEIDKDSPLKVYVKVSPHGIVFGEKSTAVDQEAEPQEPPTIPQTIPYVGHIVGLMRSKMNYYVHMRQQTPEPIYTLAMPGSKMYVVNSPDLVTAVQKQSKTLAFAPLAAKFAARICGSSAKASEILARNVNGDEGDWGLSVGAYRSMHAALAPGGGLDAMNRAMIQNIAASCDQLVPCTSDGTSPPVRIELMEWLRHEITMATTDSVYGPLNPFKDPKVEAGFWDFEGDLGLIMVNIMPSLTARKAYYGRATVAKAFEEYFSKKGHEQGSIFIKNRFQNSFEHNVPMEDIAHFEVGGSIAIMVNTTPTAFWMLYYIFSNPEVLKLLREEVGSILETKIVDAAKGTKAWSLNVTKLRSDCPILTSTFQETLRHAALGASVRLVMEDTILDGRYLLKKDCVVQIPSHVIHSDPLIWGPTVADFKPERFITDSQNRKKGTKGSEKQKKPPAAAFRAFGGGTTLCPGRHFAATEILSLVVMFLLRFDLTPLAGDWSLPKHDNSNIAAAVRSPDTDIEVDVTLRKGFEKGTWVFGLTDSELMFTMTDEDQSV